MCVINCGKFFTGVLMLATIQLTVTFSVHLLEIVKEKAQNILPKVKSPTTRDLCDLKTVFTICSNSNVMKMMNVDVNWKKSYFFKRFLSL